MNPSDNVHASKASVKSSISLFSSLPLILSVNGGYVDTAGFLALQGLFTAHVTGNFVTLGAALVLGTSGVAAKLLALPTFCLVVVATRLMSYHLAARGLPVLRTMLSLKVALLTLGGVLAIRFGPFKTGDSLMAIITGLVLVSAMAIQNAAHRIHLAAAPPTTLMTGTTTQIMIDLADFVQSRASGLPSDKRQRLLRMSASVCAFAFGCAAGALIFANVGVWCFAVPPLVAVSTLVLSESAIRGDVG
jgi:uncharacterized membrane protein YoaK (UPF0700 family)